MNLKRLFEFQQQIHTKLEYNYNVSGKTLFPHKILLLQVKLGELANETNCFKYWLTEKPVIKQSVLEKYLECIHAVIIIGLEKNFLEYDILSKPSDYDITDQFLNLYIDLNDFVVCSSKDLYITILEDILSLGITLGISESEISEGYKNLYS